MKLLSPAGNFESLKTAIYNGAEEVYLGVNEFNARNNIDGFTLSTLPEAVNFAHIYGVRVFLALNILFTDSELQSALDLVAEAYNIGVDAFIVQDLGLAKLISENYPQVELHASTQMGIHNLEGVNEIEKYGFTRVVLARETPLSEIKRIRDNSNIEIEYFVHGALCVSFSGNCYLSSYLSSASGNRGRCKQLCRLPYKLNFNGKTVKKGYLLSAKDFNMIERLTDLEKAGVTSFKIEGRARRPYYVGAVTREYRKALDGISPNKRTLELAFNREFTEGYFNGNGKIISLIQNHIGIDAGVVKKVNLGKKFNEVYVNSPIKLNAKSVLKFIGTEGEFATLSAFDIKEVSQNEYLLTTTHKIREGLKVRLISDVKEEEQFLLEVSKRKIEINLFIKANEQIKAHLKLNGNEAIIEGVVLQKPQNRPLDKIEIENCFNKSEYFYPEITYSVFEEVFCVKSALNEFRRAVYQKAEELLTKSHKDKLSKTVIDIPKEINLLTDFSIVEGKEFIEDNKTVIYSPEVYDIETIEKFVLSCKEKGVKPYLFAPNFTLKEDIELLKKIVAKTGIGVCANNYYALSLSNDVIIGGGLNVYNSLTAKVFDKPVILAENGAGEATPFAYMTLRHCPIKTHIGGTCKDCKYKEGYSLAMDGGKQLKLKRKKLTDCTFYLQ